jgi:hypothetical protein
MHSDFIPHHPQVFRILLTVFLSQTGLFRIGKDSKSSGRKYLLESELVDSGVCRSFCFGADFLSDFSQTFSGGFKGSSGKCLGRHIFWVLVKVYIKKSVFAI